MPENFEKLVIGSAHEGAEGMFHSDENKEAIDVSEFRTERGIFPDAQERYEQTLAEHGLEQLQDLGNNVIYPSLDQWVTHRIIHKRGAKFFPSFVKNKVGEVFFCKAQLSENPDALEGLEREADQLKNIPQGVNAPKLIEYIPEEHNRSAMLITEAINASVFGAKNWFPEDVPDVVRQMKLMEDKKIENNPDAPNFIENARNLLRRAGETISPDLKTTIEEIITEYEPYAKPRFVHGDACTKNILLGLQEGEGAAHFVDWEFKNTGFLGQDAAKLWSELSINKAVSATFLESYLRTPNGSLDQSRKMALIFGVASESLVHLTWRNENIITPGKEAEFPQLEQEIQSLNQKIRDAVQAVDAIAV